MDGLDLGTRVASQQTPSRRHQPSDFDGQRKDSRRLQELSKIHPSKTTAFYHAGDHEIHAYVAAAPETYPRSIKLLLLDANARARESVDLLNRPLCHVHLIDLDLGEDLDSSKARVHSGRTGTPMYAAIELSSNKYIPEPVDVEWLFFVVLKKALAPMQNAYGAHFQDNFWQQFNEINDIVHKGVEGTQPTGEHRHRPHHDVESLFWLLSFALVRAVPEDAKDHERNVAYDKFVRTLVTHKLGKDTDDRRDWISSSLLSSRKWEKTLHSGLRSLGPMLRAMGAVFLVPWSSRIQNRKSLLVHQAFKRFLFHEIHRLRGSGDILLNANEPREVCWESDSCDLL